MTDYVFTTEMTGAVAECDAPTLDQQHFLDLFDRGFPNGYLAPFRAYPDSGYELFQAFAQIGVRAALAIRRLECGSFVIFADDAARASVEVTFTRPALGAGFTVKAGTRVKTSEGGREFELLTDVVFTGSNISRTGTVFAVAPGYEWNVRGERTTATGEVLPGEIDTISLPMLDPAYAEPLLTVSQTNDATGGAAPILDGVGADRGINRLPGEPADSYRVRVRSLPDTVSPAAIRRTAHILLDPYDIQFDFIETWSVTYQTCLDAPSPNAGTPSYQAVAPTSPLYNPNLFCYDDPRPEYPLRNMMLDEREMRGAFIIVIEPVTLRDFGMAFDDPGMVPSDFHEPTTGYGRATPALDSTSADDPALVYPACYDGFDVLYAAVVFGLWQVLQEIKAAGVAAIVERRRS